jgi:hypothetical protein
MEDNPLLALSPIDSLRLRQELAAKQVVPPAQARQNRLMTGEAALGMMPVIGNAMAARDAYNSAGDAMGAWRRGDTRNALLNGGLAAISTVGAVTGLPFGANARNISKGAGSTVHSLGGSIGKSSNVEQAVMKKNHAVDNDGNPLTLYRGSDPEREYSGSLWLTDDQNHAAGFGDVSAHHARIENPLILDKDKVALSPNIQLAKDKLIEKHGLDHENWLEEVQGILDRGGYEADEVVHDLVRFGKFDGAVLDNWEGLGKTYLVNSPSSLTPSATPVKFR